MAVLLLSLLHPPGSLANTRTILSLFKVANPHLVDENLQTMSVVQSLAPQQDDWMSDDGDSDDAIDNEDISTSSLSNTQFLDLYTEEGIEAGRPPSINIPLPTDAGQYTSVASTLLADIPRPATVVAGAVPASMPFPLAPPPAAAVDSSTSVNALVLSPNALQVGTASVGGTVVGDTVFAPLSLGVPAVATTSEVIVPVLSPDLLPVVRAETSSVPPSMMNEVLPPVLPGDPSMVIAAGMAPALELLNRLTSSMKLFHLFHLYYNETPLW